MWFSSLTSHLPHPGPHVKCRVLGLCWGVRGVGSGPPKGVPGSQLEVTSQGQAGGWRAQQKAAPFPHSPRVAYQREDTKGNDPIS